MNKLIIPIIVVGIITAGIGAFFVLQKPAFPKPPKEGIGTLPEPESEAVKQKQSLKSIQDSPFGMHTGATRPFLKPDEKPSFGGFNYNDAINIGVGWERPGLYASYPLNAKLMDVSYKDIPYGINIVANIETPRQKGTFKLRISEREYQDFVKQLVERYNGDGIDDMPELKNPIKYWQIDNEPPFWQLGQNDKLSGSPMEWMRDTRDDYAMILELAGNTIHSTCPDCKLVIGGMVGMGNEQSKDIFNEFYKPILQKLNGKYIDVFDFHVFGGSNKEYLNSKMMYKIIRQGLDEYVYSDTEIWILETGTYSGQPVDMGKTMPKQLEKKQAGDLIKHFIYPLTFGVKKVFWAWAMVEGTSPIDDNDFFDNTGLIYDGIGEGDLGYGVKKLAYYTYKKMVEVLEGSDWNNIQTIQESESDGIYVYKFTKSGKPIWVAWNDNSAGKTITITGIDSQQVKITEAVPKYESGKEVMDYATAFNTETKSVSNGRITITLGDKPVFVEEQ
ncbi:MAG: hypothetical protein A2920_01770 [Candidatus Zambryskibacteria bacterium RIFCSPLOWO2_01_FULL_43_17]|uniref:Asl1-like glycosyl hydrolase catalytic domain-containing protein n=1 Tax=Candidatus Zambryskibacteria bacterium RIFCSPLOWO2_01_FULL_43_17 TaxID=1802760 RepID=A0A1G2U3P9_9BACT|nr:MAG: hypothetical protein A2920_01770 [Candidatus Zambryskibacteria bacterium RIFCSPLOWO2_01_FULL_43_17]